MARLTTLKPRLQTLKVALPSLPPQAAEQRGNSTKRGYGYKWQQARAAWLSRHPLCVHCEKEGRFTAATDVDHIQPHKGDHALFWDRSNWQSLCKSCHSAKTASEDGGYGNRTGGGRKTSGRVIF